MLRKDHELTASTLENFSVEHTSTIISRTCHLKQGQSTDSPPEMGFCFMTISKNGVRWARSLPGQRLGGEVRAAQGVEQTADPGVLTKLFIPLSYRPDQHYVPKASTGQAREPATTRDLVLDTGLGPGQRRTVLQEHELPRKACRPVC